MAKHINGYHEKKIVDVINTWSIDEKLTGMLCATG